MELGILFWFYKDVEVCENRVRMLRRHNRDVPIFGLYGGPHAEESRHRSVLGGFLDDFWTYPSGKDPKWKWRNGDRMLADWYAQRGSDMRWDSVFVAQWDTVVAAPLRTVLPSLDRGEMLVSGLRPVREVEQWWQWLLSANRAEYDAFVARVVERYGPVADPLCCQFIAMVLPREFLAPYCDIEEPELGFLEYKVPIYAQAFGVRLVPDTCFRPYWPEEPRERPPKRTEALMHAWGTPGRLPVILYESRRPHGRRVFHPYTGIYPHDVRSLRELVRRGCGRG